MSFTGWGFGFTEPNRLREDNDPLNAKRRINLLDGTWGLDLPEINQKPRRKIGPLRPALAEEQFRKATKTVLERRRREQDGRGISPLRNSSPDLIATTAPITQSRNLTPWWQSGDFEDIGADGHSENNRQVDAILKSSDTGDLPKFIADALDTGTNKALAEVSNLFSQLNDRDPKRATGLSKEVGEKVLPETRDKLEGLERQTDHPGATRQAQTETILRHLPSTAEKDRKAMSGLISGGKVTTSNKAGKSTSQITRTGGATAADMAFEQAVKDCGGNPAVVVKDKDGARNYPCPDGTTLVQYRYSKSGKIPTVAGHIVGRELPGAKHKDKTPQIKVRFEEDK